MTAERAVNTTVNTFYELELSEDLVPRQHDGEVECFMLMPLEEVQAALMKGEFTPNRIGV
jgi:hypothetical protein